MCLELRDKRSPGNAAPRWCTVSPISFALVQFGLATCLIAEPISWSFQAGKGGWQLGTIAVGNVDSDPGLEIFVPYRDTTGRRTVWRLGAYKADGTRLAGFPYQAGEHPVNVSPTLQDLDGDGRAEILFTRGPAVVALKGDGSVLWSTTVGHQDYVPDGGFQAVTNGFYWSSTGLWRDRLPDTAEFFSEVSSPIVGDFDGNGSLKVATAWKILPDRTSAEQDYNPFIKPLYGFADWGTVGDTWSGGVVFFDARSGKKDFVYHIHQLVESGLAMGKARPEAAPIVYVLNDSDSVAAFDKTRPYGLWGKGMLHKQFGKNQRLQSGSYLKGVDVYTADIDGDGEDEVLVPTTQLDPLWQPSETILDDDGAVLWRKWKSASAVPVAHGWLNNACMIPVNPDHDNRVDVLSFTHSYEIAFRSWNGIELTDRPGWPKNFHPFLPTPPVVGDVDGDGAEEIVIGTYDPAVLRSNGRLYIFALDGREKFSREVPGGLKHIPTLADANADGALDVIYRSLDGIIHIDSFGAPAAGAVSWATHRGNVRRDGNREATLFPPGTPLITSRESGVRQTTFTWRSAGNDAPQGYQIVRAAEPEGPFREIARLPGTTHAFTDSGLQDGWLYFYEVRAVYQTRTVASAPFAILSFVGGNLIRNAGFEEDDNSHWDKWFTGGIPWRNMTGSQDQPYQGKRSMEVRLENHGDGSSIKQSNQYGIPEPAIRTYPGKLYSFGGFIRSPGLSQPSEHWLEWNTTHAGDDTNDVPPAPWPVYFTPHLAIDTKPTPWTYLNRVFTMPPGFPHVELRHRYTIRSPGTGSIYIDNVFFRELPSLDDPRWRELIPFGTTWNYFTESPSRKWFTEKFDASSWPQGRAKFGGGTGTRPITTPLPLMRPAYYFRREFSMPEGEPVQLLLLATATDDYNGQTYPLKVYLNGNEVGPTRIDAVTGDGHGEKQFDLLPFAGLVRPGVNHIAVILQNGWATDWDNVAFDLSLKVIMAEPRTGPAKFSSIEPNQDGGVTLQIQGPAGTDWTIEWADSPEPSSNWQTVQSLRIGPTKQAIATDSGGEGRVLPRSARRRFYRIKEGVQTK